MLIKEGGWLDFLCKMGDLFLEPNHMHELGANLDKFWVLQGGNIKV
jgi:hypothetical protein